MSRQISTPGPNGHPKWWAPSAGDPCDGFDPGGARLDESRQVVR